MFLSKPDLPSVAIHSDAGPEDILNLIQSQSAPMIFKGLVANWPAVLAEQSSPLDLIDYLKACDSGKPAETFRQARGDGRFFYGQTERDFNFQRASVPISVTLERLRSLFAMAGEEHIYIQSAPLPGLHARLKAENALNLPGFLAEPRIWIGNRSVTQIHFDLYENLVCMVGGRKRFVLFPPDQVRNLYMGPLETTVSGVPTSMVNFDTPDFKAHPRFAEALSAATVADLEPGDVLYIPYMWWHHVISEADLNVQVNYWWNSARPELGQPIHALFHAMLSLRDLPREQNAAWKAMFDHLIFHGSDPVSDHLGREARGILGDLTDDQRQAIRSQLGKNLQTL